MANDPIYYSASGDIRATEALHQEIQLLLADRASLRGHPAILQFGDLAGSGSTVRSVPFFGLDGYDEMEAVNENASVSRTDPTDASADITIARQALRYSISDLNNMVDSVGLDVERLAASMVGAAEMRFTSMICGVLDDFTSTVGSTGVDLDVDDFYDAIYTLEEANANGPFTSVLHPVQVTDFQNSLRAEGGAVQYKAATQDMLEAKGQGFIGSFAGVDIYKSSKVPTANTAADRAGAMFARGAVGFAEGTPRPMAMFGGQLVLAAGTPILVEFDRTPEGALTDIVGSYYVGVQKLQDALGVSIITDA